MAAKTIIFENPKTGQTREAPVGFSWTVLFFNFFVPLFRSDWKWAVIMFLALIVTNGLSALVFMFIYNKLYIKDLLSVGFSEKDPSFNIEDTAINHTASSEVTSTIQNTFSGQKRQPSKQAGFEAIGCPKKSSDQKWGDYVFWGVLTFCSFVVVASFVIGRPEFEYVTEYVHEDGRPLTAAELSEKKRIERISRQAESEARAINRRYSVASGLTSVDVQVISEYERRRQAGDIRGACGAMMLYSGPNAQSAKARIASTCAGYGVSTFSGINGY